MAYRSLPELFEVYRRTSLVAHRTSPALEQTYAGQDNAETEVIAARSSLPQPTDLNVSRSSLVSSNEHSEI